MKKPLHPADDVAGAVASATYFTATIWAQGKHHSVRPIATLKEAREVAATIEAAANNGRKALVYAVGRDGRSTLIPKTYGGTQ